MKIDKFQVIVWNNGIYVALLLLPYLKFLSKVECLLFDKLNTDKVFLRGSAQVFSIIIRAPIAVSHRLRSKTLGRFGASCLANLPQVSRC